MCGIAGLISAGPRPDTAELVRRMTAALAHRGPDGEGCWMDDQAALGHRRLAIIDVAGGAQPLVNETGSVRVVCNGEIYNYRQLRSELEARGHRFQTASDCETIVHLYEDEGPDAIARLHGMFALAIWDRAARRLVLARDRIGIKPLFYASGSRGFGFASEIKALVAAGLTECRVDPAPLRTFSVTFPEDRVFDEARFSRQVARQIGSVHTEIPLTRMDILSALEPALDYLDEPFADPSLLPCFAIAREARRHVKVVLSGDGADELVVGYTQYLGEPYAARVRPPLIWLLAQVSALGPSGRGNRLEEAVRQLRRVTDGGGIPETGRRYARWAQVCGEAEVQALVPDLAAAPAMSQLFAAEAHGFETVDHGDAINRMLYTDCRLGLPGDMLAKVDISSMANALEVRVPFLDHRLVECAFRIPWRWKIRALRGKRILPRTFRDVLPPEIPRRGKRGFAAPLGA